MILIILATVTINVAFGEGGLIQRAQQAKNLTEQAILDEENSLNSLINEYDKIMNEEEKEEVECTDIYVTLYEDGTLAFSSTQDKKLDKAIKTEYGNIKGEDYTVDLKVENPELPQLPWTEEVENITNVIILDEIVPSSTSWWFYGLGGVSEISNIKSKQQKK